jgi:3-oxoacyl-[acyl-carrier protein] reductase
MVDREYPVQETAGRESTRISRSGEPVDVAATIRYLASPDASDVTGQVFGVDAGCVLGR